MRISRRTGGQVIALLAAVCLLLAWPAALAAQSGITWEAAGGPPGGRVNAIAIDPQNPATLYAATPNGIYKSVDGAEQWARLALPAPLECQEVRALILDPLDSQRLYAGGDGGLLRSTDAGATWQALGLDLPAATVLALAIHPVQTNRLYVSLVGAVYLSDDWGEHWRALSPADQAVNAWSLAPHPSDPGTLYLGTDTGVYMIRDAGNDSPSWQDVSVGLAPDEPVRALVIDPQEPTRLYAATLCGLWRSLDGAASWAALTPTLDTTESATTCGVTALLLADNHTLYANVGLGSVSTSSDGGESWVAGSPLGGSRLVWTLARAPGEQAALYVGAGDGLFKSLDDGLTWQAATTGIVSSQVEQIIDVPGTRGELYALTPGGLYRTTDDGATWQQADAGLELVGATYLAPDPQASGRLYAVTGQGIYVSIDSGARWNLSGVLPRGTTPTGLVAYQPEERGSALVLYLGTAEAGVWRSRDAGYTWTRWADGLPQGSIGALAILPGNLPCLLAGVQRAIYCLALDVTTDAPVWAKTTAEPLNGAVTGLVSDPGSSAKGHDDKLYATTDRGGIYVGLASDLTPSVDQTPAETQPWRVLVPTALFADQPIDSLAVTTGQGDARLLCTVNRGTLIYSQDDGQTWSLSSTGCLQQVGVRCVAADDRDASALYVGTAGGGVQRLRVTRAERGLSGWGLVLVVLAGAVVAAGLAAAAILLLRARRRRMPPALQSSDEEWQAWDTAITNVLAQRDQVVPNALSSIPQSMRLLAMRRYTDVHRDLDLILREDPTFIEVANRWKLRRFVNNWTSLVERLDSVQRAAPLAARITEQLCDLLGFTPLESRSFRSLFGYEIKAPAVRLSIPPRFPFIFVLERELGPETMVNVRDMMRVLNVTSFFGLLIVIDRELGRREKSESLQRLARSGAHDLIVLDYHDLRSLYLARDPERQLVELILRQVDLAMISPYVLSGPVPENMFFGHDYELKTIMRLIRDRSFAIVGGRKIGKTSVLNKVHRLMQQTNGFAPFYLDCQFVVNYDEFFSTLAFKCQVQVESASPEVMRRVVLRLRRQYSDQVVLLLDEVDRILAYDMQHDMRLFRLFRALSQEGLCRFVFCGERLLNQVSHDASSPLFNFASALRLTYLTPRDARRIVDEPMAAMGIAFESPEELPDKIVELSSCHPNLVQVICQMLIMRINALQESPARRDRIIRMDDLAQVRASSEWHDTFFEVIWGDATNLERLISMLMVSRPRFTLDDVQRELEQRAVHVPPQAIVDALDGLVFYSVLKQQGEHYTYAAPSFVELAIESNLAEVYIEGLLEKLQAKT